MVMLHGDCLELLPRVAGGSVDMVFADLPYGVTANKWDSVIPFEPLWAELLRVGKRNAAFVFTATQPFATTLICSQPSLFRYDLVWEKTNATGFMNAKKRPLGAHEGIYLFGRKLSYCPQKYVNNGRKVSLTSARTPSANYGNKSYKAGYTDDGTRYPRSVMKFDRDRGANGHVMRIHPTQKPVALLEWLIRTYSNPGDTILDPTAGSGTTGVACLNTDRKFIGIEKDATYFATAQHRLERAQNESQLRLRMDEHQPGPPRHQRQNAGHGSQDQRALAPRDRPTLALPGT